MSKSISWHKEKIMARMQPSLKSHQKEIKIEIEQYTLNQNKLVAGRQKKNKLFVVFVKVSCEYPYKAGDHFVPFIKSPKGLGKGLLEPITLKNKVLCALYELLDENKLETDISNKEWNIQVALGTALKRTITLPTGL